MLPFTAALVEAGPGSPGDAETRNHAQALLVEHGTLPLDSGPAAETRDAPIVAAARARLQHRQALLRGDVDAGQRTHACTIDSCASARLHALDCVAALGTLGGGAAQALFLEGLALQQQRQFASAIDFLHAALDELGADTSHVHQDTRSLRHAHQVRCRIDSQFVMHVRRM